MKKCIITLIAATLSFGALGFGLWALGFGIWDWESSESPFNRPMIRKTQNALLANLNLETTRHPEKLKPRCLFVNLDWV